MRFTYFGVLAATGVLAGAGYDPAAAQPQVPGGGGNRPVTSPYLNLLRGGTGSSPTLNYYGLVRPEQQLRQQANQIQQQLTQTNTSLQGLAADGQNQDSGLPATGQGAVFFFYSHYYPGLGGGGSGGPIGGAGMANRGFARQQIGAAPAGNISGGSGGGRGGSSGGARR